jgi:hypothetical protein
VNSPAHKEIYLKGTCTDDESEISEEEHSPEEKVE